MQLPLIVEPEQLAASLGADNLLVVDLCNPQSAAQVPGAVRNVRAERGAHIPGAVNFNWVNAIDQERNLRLKTAEELRPLLEDVGAVAEKEVIAYCQTHHRSSHTYAVLKSLGYQRIKGYPGAWSEWGNLADTPVEV